MAIISFFDRLSRMSLNWVSGVKSPFFPDMKKAACEFHKLLSEWDILLYNDEIRAVFPLGEVSF